MGTGAGLAVVDTVTKSYGSRVVLAGCSMRVEAGDLVVVRGVNGAGKSTLLKIVAGLESPGDGGVSIGGKAPGTAVAKRLLTYIPDQPVLFDEMSVRENVVFSAQLFGMDDPGGEADRAIVEFGLDDHADLTPPALSRGLRQRAQLARALTRPWQIALIDEPFSGLDTAGRRTLIDRLRIEADAGRAAVIASHDEQAMECATRVIEVVRGALAER